MTRRFRFTYGSQQIGGVVATTSATLALHGVHRIQRTAEEVEVALSFVLHTTDIASDFSAAVAKVEADLSAPRQRLRLEILSAAGDVLATPLDLDPAEHTGLGVTPSLAKGEDDEAPDSARSRLYRLEVTARLPQSWGSQAGLLADFEWRLEFDPGRTATLTTTGAYSAVGSNAAKAQYDAEVAAREASITSLLGGTWELVSEAVTPDDENTLARFERVHRRLRYRQSSGALELAGVREQRLTVEVDRPGIDGDDTGRPLVTIRVRYSAFLDADVLGDASGEVRAARARDFYRATIRPWILQHVLDVADRGIALERDEDAILHDTGELTVTLSALTPGDSDVISRTVQTEDSVDFGKILRKEWPARTPEEPLEPTASYVYQGPKTVRRTTTTTSRTLGHDADSGTAGPGRGGRILVGIGGEAGRIRGDALLGGNPNPDPFAPWEPPEDAGASEGAEGSPGQTRVVPIERTVQTTPLTLGRPPSTLDVTDRTVVDVVELVLGVAGRPTTGGGGDPRRTRTR